jgi:hypothetical protein
LCAQAESIVHLIALTAAAAFLMLLNTGVDIAKGVLMFPILEGHGKRTAIAYLAAMTLEVALMAVGIVSLLLLVPLEPIPPTAGRPGSVQS